MGMNLRYSPLEWDEVSKMFDFGGSTITNATIASLLSTTGNVFYVSSVAADGGLDKEGNQGSTPAKPLKTWDYAYSRCTANNDDVIVLMPGYTGNVTAAADIACDVAGVTTVGLGHGADRPTLTWTATASSIDITAASTRIFNIIGVAGIDSITEAFNVQAADCEIDIEWQDGSATVEAITVFLCNASADRLKINLDYYGFTAGNACDSPISLNGSVGGEITVNFYGKAATAVVEFITAAVEDINITGYFYCSGTTDLSKNVVDTVTGSTWFVQGFDGAAGSAFSGGSGNAVAAGDLSTISTNVDSILVDTGTTIPATITTAQNDLDIITGATGVNLLTATQASIDAIELDTGTTIPGTITTAQNDLDIITGATGVNLLTATQASIDAIELDTGTTIPGTITTLQNAAEKAVTGSTAVMVNGDTIFTIAGGPIRVIDLVSICITSNDGTASTLQYSADPTVGAAVTFSGASASLAAFAAGGGVVLNQTALDTAPDLSTVMVGLGSVSTNKIIINEGIITVVIGVGSTTGTWKHYLRYAPLGPGVTVVGT